MLNVIIWYRWRNVRQAAKSKGLSLRLISNKQYHNRKRPMPRAGRLYIFDTDLCVRYQRVTPQEAIEFIKRKA